MIPQAVDIVGAAIGIVAALAFLLLLPLYASQRRDVRRLRRWMEHEPDFPQADLANSERILDRSERELEELLGPDGAGASGREAAPGADPVPTGVSPAAQRVTADRPALARATAQWEALHPTPRWQGLLARVSRPRVLAVIGAAMLVAAGAALAISEDVLRLNGEPERGGRAAAVRGETTVAVLNATAVPGLAATVADDVESAGYEVGSVTNVTEPRERSVVMFRRGSRRAARRVARRLEVRSVQPIAGEARGVAGGAGVVVIAGEDAARRF